MRLAPKDGFLNFQSDSLLQKGVKAVLHTLNLAKTIFNEGV